MDKKAKKPQQGHTAKGQADASIRSCPHWSATSKTCMLVTDGLFLPVQEHILTYCTSTFYPSCRHYQLLATPQTHAAPTDHLPVNRRRSVRIPRHHVFRFSEISPKDRIPTRRTQETWTIDLSQQGIRFASYRFLPPNTLIRFALEGEDTLCPPTGEGRVVWSEPLENTPLFHAGIALVD
jgi:hypothetical protein